MERPKRSPKKKADPAFVYGKASPLKKDSTAAGTTPATGKAAMKDSKKNTEKVKEKGTKKKGKGDSKSSSKKEIETEKCEISESRSTPKSSKSGSPAPKRSRLSLKGLKQGKDAQKIAPLFNHQPKEASTAPDLKTVVSGNAGTKTPTGKSKDRELVGVAALHNLGNTCFLNSIMQVLRHTPGFQENLHALAKEISITMKEKSLIAEIQDEQDEKPTLTWELVKGLKDLFVTMTNRESNVKNGESKFIAHRPYEVLQVIEQLNPMFQGNLQQDAHEFLRCILAYIQDATKEVNKYRKCIREASAAHNEQYKQDQSETTPATPTETFSASITDSKNDKTVLLAKEIKVERSNIKEEDGVHISSDGELKYESDNRSMTSLESVVLLEEIPECRPPIKKPETGSGQGKKKLARGKKGDAQKQEPCEGTTEEVNESEIIKSDQPGKRGRRKRGKGNDGSDAAQNTMLKFLKSSEDSPNPSGQTSTTATVEVHRGDGDFVKGSEEEAADGKPAEDGDTDESKRGVKRKVLCSGGSPDPAQPGPSGIPPDHDYNRHFAENQTSKTENVATVDDNAKEAPKKRLGMRGRTAGQAGSKTSSVNNVQSSVGPAGDVKSECHDKEDSNESSTSQSTSQGRGNSVSRSRRPVVKLKKLHTGDMDKYHFKPKSVLEISRKTDVVGDCVEQLFQGTMSHRTKCLECETLNDRREEYQDISIPVKKSPKDRSRDDSDDEESSGPCAWFTNAMEEVERLDGDNKYLCERCDHLVEAERSVHYQNLPALLTLHLKRFAALDGYGGGFTKITEYVTTPFVLPHLEKVFDGDDRFELYGLVTHSGFSLSSGHYVAYVRADPGHPSLPHNKPAPPGPEASPPPEQAAQPTQSMSAAAAAAFPAPGGDGEMADPNNNADTNNNLDTGSPNRNLETPPETPGTSGQAAEPSAGPSAGPNVVPPDNQHYWFECDDDVVSVLSPKEFEKVLSPNATGTPYMLFYARVTQ